MTLKPLLFGLVLAHSVLSAFAGKPNIIFFLTDDQGYGDLGCMGSKTIKTPNIDKLCVEGMKFTSFYVHNRCSPTRLALMTGSYAHRAGCSKVIYYHDEMGINDNEITVAELLKKAGYATGIVGKWHLGEHEQFNPVKHGFDMFYGFMLDANKGTGIYRNLKLLEKTTGKTDGVHTPKLVKAGVEFIKANKDKPFFLYYASPLPHVKWKPNERFRGKSAHGAYGDVVEEIDWQFGELMKTLDELKLTGNTLVIYASDNGPQLGLKGCGSAGPLRDGKWTNFEGGIRSPCLMRWPGVIPEGAVNNEITGVIDILPTFCAIAGVPVPSDRVLDGRNILPYMKGEKVKPIHDTFIVPGSTIRYGKWKLMVNDQKPGGKQSGWGKRVPARAGSLFDLEKDISETTDVSKQHPEIVDKLKKLMAAAMKELAANSREIGKTPNYTGKKPKKVKRRKKKQ